MPPAIKSVSKFLFGNSVKSSSWLCQETGTVFIWKCILYKTFFLSAQNNLTKWKLPILKIYDTRSKG